MRSNALNYFAVGLFVIAMVAALVAVLALLTGRTGATDTYYTRYPAANGLKFGTAVLYMGYPVGQVESIEPLFGDDASVEFVVEMSVQAGWRIPEGSVAQVRAAGLLAAITIDIRAGPGPTALAPGDSIAGEGQTDLFGAVSDTANTVKQLTEGSIKPLMTSLDHYVQTVGQSMERDAAPLLTDLRVLAAELAGRAPVLVTAFLELAEELRTTSEQLRAFTGDDNVERVDSIVGNLEQTSQHLVELAASTREQVGELLGDGTRGRVHGALDNVAQASEEVAGLSRDARTRVNQVLGDDTAQRFRAALDNVSLAAGNIAGLSEELRGTGGQVQRLLAGLEQTVDSGRPDVEQSLTDLRYTLRMLAEHVDSVAYNLEGTSRNMYEFSRELRRNPGLLLGGTPPVDRAVVAPSGGRE